MPTIRGSLRFCAWATIYVLAWLSGLAAGPFRPANPTASQLHGFYLESGDAALVQALLVHGIAGLALAGMAMGLPRATAANGPNRWALAAGLGAAVASLVQAAVAAVTVLQVDAMTAEDTLGLVHAIDRLDSLKLLLLAVFVAAVTTVLRRNGFAARWIAASAVLLVPMLVIGAAAFAVSNQVLDTILAGSLVLLLVWASGIAWAMRPRRAPITPEIRQSQPSETTRPPEH